MSEGFTSPLSIYLIHFAFQFQVFVLCSHGFLADGWRVFLVGPAELLLLPFFVSVCAGGGRVQLLGVVNSPPRGVVVNSPPHGVVNSPRCGGELSAPWCGEQSSPWWGGERRPGGLWCG